MLLPASELRRLLAALAGAPRVVVLLDMLCTWFERRFPGTAAAAYAFDTLTGREVLARVRPRGAPALPNEIRAESPLVRWLELTGALTTDAAVTDLPLGIEARETLQALAVDAAVALPGAEGLAGLILLEGQAARDLGNPTWADTLDRLTLPAGVVLGNLIHREALDLLGRISPGARHELGNLLTAPQACLDLLAEPATVEVARRLRPHAARSFEQMRQHIDRARELWERDEKVWSRLGLAAVLDSAIAAKRSLAEKYEVKLGHTCPPDLAMDADAMLLTRMLLNLLDHAIPTAASGERVTLEARGVGGNGSGPETIRLAVRQTGPSSLRDRHWALLEPAFAITRAGEGRGAPTLALLVCREIVAWHGGRITVATAASGTQVGIDLPARQPGLPGEDGCVRTGNGN